jgi:hypothetical protein
MMRVVAIALELSHSCDIPETDHSSKKKLYLTGSISRVVAVAVIEQGLENECIPDVIWRKFQAELPSTGFHSRAIGECNVVHLRTVCG